MARKQQKRHNRGSDRRKTAHAHRSTRHMQPVRTQKTVRRRLPEAEVRRRQRARRRQFALLGLAVLLIVLIFAFRHLISTPQQSGADGDTGNSGTSATEEVKQVAKAVNVYQSVMYYQPVVQKYAEQNGIPEYTDVLLAIMQVESGGKLTDIMQSSGSAGLPNDSLEEESSIRQGCTYFAHLLSKGKSLDCDLDRKRMRQSCARVCQNQELRALLASVPGALPRQVAVAVRAVQQQTPRQLYLLLYDWNMYYKLRKGRP